jgi:hypothetical protein
MRSLPASGTIAVQVPRDTRGGRPERVAELSASFSRITFKKPANRRGDGLPELVGAYGVRVWEANPPDGAEPIEWLLCTTEKVESLDDAARIVSIYVKRWTIERFHYVLKSGLKVKRNQSRSLERLNSIITIFSIMPIYIMALSHYSRSCPETSCDILFEEEEWKILYMLANKAADPPDKPYPIRDAARWLARLGGFGGAPSDGEPGEKVLWQGMSRLSCAVALGEIIGIVKPRSRLRLNI